MLWYTHNQGDYVFDGVNTLIIMGDASLFIFHKYDASIATRRCHVLKETSCHSRSIKGTKHIVLALFPSVPSKKLASHMNGHAI